MSRHGDANDESTGLLAPVRSASPSTSSFHSYSAVKLNPSNRSSPALSAATSSSSSSASIPSSSPDKSSLPPSKPTDTLTFLQNIRARLSSMMEGKNALVVTYSVLLLVTSVANNIFFKSMLTKLQNYVYFLNQFTTIVYIPIFFGLVWYELLFTTYITAEMRNFAKSKFFVMGIFDSLSGVLGLLGGVHTSGGIQALLTNAVIPVNMCLAYFLLRTRYSKSQYFGSFVICLGCFVALIPNLFGSSADSGGDVPVFNLLFLIAVVPSALSSIYKEIAFNDSDIDANYLQAWVAVFQFLVGFALMPLNTLKLLGPQAIQYNQIGSALVEGAWCLAGYNTRVPPSCVPYDVFLSEGLDPDTTVVCDMCEGAWVPTVVYLVFNVMFNAFSILLIKYGNATLMFIIMTLRLPIINVAFSMQIFNDPPDPFQWSSMGGLAVIVLGLVIYRLKDEQQADSQPDAVVPVFGMSTIYSTLRHERIVAATQLKKKTSHQLRSALYTSLGILDSPHTPHTARHRSGNSSPLPPPISIKGNGSFSRLSPMGSPKSTPTSNSPLLSPGHVATIGTSSRAVVSTLRSSITPPPPSSKPS